MLKVGHTKVAHKDKERILGYDLVEYCVNGFADANIYTPHEYDMCVLLTDKNIRKNGWWTGQEYWALRMNPDEKVVAWRKCKDM